ncbi:MAG: hypothetical protein MUC97_05590 [Bernardetiaceae bacterium]|jgi:hypothetical protein|nr:hypothetical protein [Bernardetiaceae bacterium]
MLPYLLWLRLRTLGRLLAELGLGRLVLLGLLAAYAGLRLGGWAAQAPQWLAALGLAPVLAVHLGRNDTQFLAGLSPRWRWLMAGEYLALVAPFLVYCLGQGLASGPSPTPLLAAGGLAVATLAVAWGLPTRSATLSAPRPLGFLPARAYTWRAGLRKNWPVLPLAWGLGGLAWLSPGWPVLGAVLLMLQMASFQFACEPRLFLELPNLGPRQFLHAQMRQHVGYATLALLPVLLGLILGQPMFWWLALALGTTNALLQAFAVCLKYGAWQEAAFHEHHLTLDLIYLASLLVPFLWPVPVFLLLRAYRRAKKELTGLIPAPAGG